MTTTRVTLEPLTAALAREHARAVGMDLRAWVHHAVVSQMAREDTAAETAAFLHEVGLDDESIARMKT